MLTMVISQCQDHGSAACALRSALLKTELKEKTRKTTTRLRLRTQSDNTLQPSNSQTSLAWTYRSETQTNHSIGDSTGEYTTLLHRTTKTVQAKPPEKGREFSTPPLGVRRTVKSLTAAVVTGSLHPNEKPLSAELRRYHGHLSELHTQGHEHASDKHFGVRVVPHPL